MTSLKDTNLRYSFFNEKEFNEQVIKIAMKPTDSFNPCNINNYINPQKSKEELILDKINTCKKLNSTERLQHELFTKTKQKLFTLDLTRIERIKSNGSGDLPETEEGKLLLLLHYLNKYIESNNVVSICNIYLKFQKENYNFTPEINRVYNSILSKMEEIVNKADLIQLQFTKFYDSMPPLNITGFKKFDPWQLNVIENINKGISTIVSAPTSAGKTVLAGYATTKGRTLIVMPTDALCWQMASYIGGFLNKDIPVLTNTFTSIDKENCPCINSNSSCSLCSFSTRDKIVKKLNDSIAIVGTPDALLNFIPLINSNFDWIIFDEIHMIGKPEGSSMEIIAKVFNKVKFLALSATIGNINELTTWFKEINQTSNIQNIICDKRFFNLQRYYYDQQNDNLNVLHPLALVDYEDFENGSANTKNFQATPIDTWLLYSKLKEAFGDLKELNHNNYFTSREIIHLNKANNFFTDLIKFMVNTTKTESGFKINKIINSFKNIIDSDESVDLVKLAFKLKAENKTPAIIFQKDTLACIKMFMNFAKIITNMENEEFPNLFNDRVRDHEKGAKIKLDIASLLAKEESNKKMKKHNKSNTEDPIEDRIKELDDILSNLQLEPLHEPHYKYNFNQAQLFSEDEIKKLIIETGFTEKNDKLHIIIKLLWSGVGIYAQGLPEAYLRVVQKLTCEKRIAILFSDMSLVFGVSMPFRTTVIYKNPNIIDDLDPMLYHQMVGRAGRRGLDKEGNIVFAGFKWNRILELSTCSIPNVCGSNIKNYTLPHVIKLAQLKKNNLNWNKIFDNCLDKTDSSFNELKSNYDTKWSFAFNDDINHLWLMWTLRNSGLFQPIIISYLLLIIKNKYDTLDYNNTNNQNMLFQLISHFLDSNISNKTEEMDEISKNLKNLDIPVCSDINNDLSESFIMNKIINTSSDYNNHLIRQRLLNLSQRIIAIQYYFHHTSSNNIVLLLGKIIKRMKNIYNNSSLLINPIINESEYQPTSNNNLHQLSFTYYYDFIITNNKILPTVNNKSLNNIKKIKNVSDMSDDD